MLDYFTPEQTTSGYSFLNIRYHLKQWQVGRLSLLWPEPKLFLDVPFGKPRTSTSPRSHQCLVCAAKLENRPYLKELHNSWAEHPSLRKQRMHPLHVRAEIPPQLLFAS